MDVEEDPYDGPNTLVVFDKKSSSIHRFKPAADEWHTADNGFTEDMVKWSFTATVLDEELYILMNNRAVHRLEQRQGEASWKRLADMIMNHGQYPPVVVMEDSIHVIGSSGVGGQIDGGERYITKRNKWVKIPSMRKERRNHALTSHDGYIFCIGGVNRAGPLFCGERYDPTDHVWKFVPKMKEGRHSASALVLDDSLFVVGGFATGRRRKDVICLSLVTWEWTCARHMTLPRASFLVCIVDGKMFAVGGDNGPCDTVEVYDKEEDKWEFLDISCTLEVDAAVNIRS